MNFHASISPRIFAIIGQVNATPGVTKPDETIDGFPEFAFTIDTIKDPTVKAKLRATAKRIVESHKGANRIIGFEVHGHADQTMRMAAGAERDEAEFEVSRNRAENAKELLFQMIEDEGGKPIMTHQGQLQGTGLWQQTSSFQTSHDGTSDAEEPPGGNLSQAVYFSAPEAIAARATAQAGSAHEVSH